MNFISTYEKVRIWKMKLKGQYYLYIIQRKRAQIISSYKTFLNLGERPP